MRIYELDATRHAGILLCTREQFEMFNPQPDRPESPPEFHPEQPSRILKKITRTHDRTHRTVDRTDRTVEKKVVPNTARRRFGWVMDCNSRSFTYYTLDNLLEIREVPLEARKDIVRAANQIDGVDDEDVHRQLPHDDVENDADDESA